MRLKIQFSKSIYDTNQKGTYMYKYNTKYTLLWFDRPDKIRKLFMVALLTVGTNRVRATFPTTTLK